MPSKKYTAQKREEMKASNQKQDQSNILKPFLIMIVVLVVIVAIVFAGLYLLENNSNTETETNNIPILKADYAVFKLNSNSNSIDVLSNDEDEDGDILNITEVGTPSNGIAEIVRNKIIYTPNTDFTGAETFTYTVSDGEKESTSTVNVIVADKYPIALMDTTKGMIVLELYNDKVVNTSENFIKLANSGFYEGLVFHRVIDNFMIQGGAFNPDGTQKESPYGTIDLEISSEVRHVDGAISMARTNDPNSATSQFFICDGAQSYLDDNYAVFGVVVSGMDVVRAIASVDTGTKYNMEDWPIEDVIINSITIENYE